MFGRREVNKRQSSKIVEEGGGCSTRYNWRLVECALLIDEREPDVLNPPDANGRRKNGN